MIKFTLNNGRNTNLNSSISEVEAKKMKLESFSQNSAEHGNHYTKSKNKKFLSLSKSKSFSNDKVRNMYNNVVVTGLKYFSIVYILKLNVKIFKYFLKF